MLPGISLSRPMVRVPWIEYSRWWGQAQSTTSGTFGEAKEFDDVVSPLCQKINIINVPKEDIDNAQELLDARWANAKAVPGTQKVDCVKVLGVNCTLYAKHPRADVCNVHSFMECAQQNVNQRSGETENALAISKERYFAVYYDHTFYIGRALVLDSSTVTMKFLHSSFEKQFAWPSKDDVDSVKKVFIFYGPVTLEGIGPFREPLNELKDIQAAYKTMQKRLKQPK